MTKISKGYRFSKDTIEALERINELRGSETLHVENAIIEYADKYAPNKKKIKINKLTKK